MLESILKKYFCKGNNKLFDKNSELTDKGAETYGKLISLLYEIGELAEVDVNDIVDNLNLIVNEKV